jgi:hypothetical protein
MNFVAFRVAIRPVQFTRVPTGRPRLFVYFSQYSNTSGAIYMASEEMEEKFMSIFFVPFLRGAVRI